MSTERATADFHEVIDIPAGSTLHVQAKVTAGTVQGRATFLSGQQHDWTYAQLRQGVEATILGFSWLRIFSSLQPASNVRVDARISHQGQVIRHRFWELNGGKDGSDVHHGLVIDAGGNDLVAAAGGRT